MNKQKEAVQKKIDYNTLLYITPPPPEPKPMVMAFTPNQYNENCTNHD